MKTNLILLLAILIILPSQTTAASQPNAAANIETNQPSQLTTKAADPGKPTSSTKSKPTQTNSDPAMPTVELCSVNKLGTVPGCPTHTFSLKNIQPKTYQNSDFDVTWKQLKLKKHKFFKYIGKKSNFAKAFTKMNCQPSDKKGFGSVCNYKESDVEQFYKNAFGQDIIYKCKVPQNSFALNIRFVLQLSDFPTSAGGRWSVFTGLHKYKSQNDAEKKIVKKAKKINKKIRTTKLDTFDINYNLNIIPDFVKGTLSWVFNSNINSTFVSDVGYIKILPPGTEFIIGCILNGTTQVKQICDNYRFDDSKDYCGFTF